MKYRCFIAILIFIAVALTAMVTLHAFQSDQDQFVAMDLWIDAGDTPVAAWQTEITYDPATIKIVGIESGDSPYTQAPRHDSKGLTGGRIILANYITTGCAPKGRVRVGRIHLYAATAPQLGVKLMAAANPTGERIIPSVSLTPALKP